MTVLKIENAQKILIIRYMNLHSNSCYSLSYSISISLYQIQTIHSVLKITREFPGKQPYSHLYGDDVGREDEPRRSALPSTLVARIRKLNAVGHSSLFETWRIFLSRSCNLLEKVS